MYKTTNTSCFYVDIRIQIFQNVDATTVVTLRYEHSKQKIGFDTEICLLIGREPEQTKSLDFAKYLAAKGLEP